MVKLCDAKEPVHGMSWVCNRTLIQVLEDNAEKLHQSSANDRRQSPV